jgi:hypothetical protein
VTPAGNDDGKGGAKVIDLMAALRSLRPLPPAPDPAAEPAAACGQVRHSALRSDGHVGCVSGSRR